MLLGEDVNHNITEISQEEKRIRRSPDYLLGSLPASLGLLSDLALTLAV